MKVKKFLKPFGRIRVHVHSVSDEDNSIVCWSDELKDYNIKNAKVLHSGFSRFQVYIEDLNSEHKVQGLDIEVE